MSFKVVSIEVQEYKLALGHLDNTNDDKLGLCRGAQACSSLGLCKDWKNDFLIFEIDYREAQHYRLGEGLSLHRYCY